ncbi:MAG: alpha/beta hydrolase, partial [Deltaproteobacteria bacterium]
MVLARTTLTAGGLQFGALTAGRGDSIVLCLHGFPDT